MVNVGDKLGGSVTSVFAVLVVVLVKQLVDIHGLERFKQLKKRLVACCGAGPSHDIEAISPSDKRICRTIHDEDRHSWLEVSGLIEQPIA